jgi:hypothetical protein
MKVAKSKALAIAYAVIDHALKNREKRKQEALKEARDKFFNHKWFGNRRIKKYITDPCVDRLELTEQLLEDGVIWDDVNWEFVKYCDAGLIVKAKEIISICKFLEDDEFIEFDQKTVSWLSEKARYL